MKTTSKPWHPKEEQLLKFNTHLKDFGISKNEELILFEEFIKGLNNFFLECSCKIINGKISGSRFAVIFKDDDHSNNIKKSFLFLDKLKNADLDLRLAKQLNFINLNSSGIKATGIGIDLRENSKDSRVKIWAVCKNENYKLFNSAIQLFGDSDKISELISKNEVLFGFDFFFDCRTKMKLYPHFYEYELRNKVVNQKLSSIFDKDIMRLVDMCFMFYVSFEGKENKKVLHFNPHSIVELQKALRIDSIKLLLNKISYPYKNCIVTLVEEELITNNIKTINFYY